MPIDESTGRSEPTYAPVGPNPYAPAEPNPYAPGGEYSIEPTPAVVPERVVPGLALALLAIPVGAGLAAIIWHLGFIASISTFVLAASAAFLYRKGSGGQVRRGIPGIAAIIVVGAVVSFFAVVASDASTYYNENADARAYSSRSAFIFDNLFYAPVLKGYAKDAGLFALFAALGAFGVITRLVRANRSPTTAP